ncbi:MAG TPA: glycosyltransferase family 39 protein [Chthoniobacterales bacterium]|nr:glycosyltransferase family 39 protein [Chthoniobacterales bacterium]
MSLRLWLLLLLVITIAVRTPTMFGVKRTGWDERAYVVFAQTLDKVGVSGIRQWLHEYPINEQLQKSPLFLRVGFIVPAMLTCKLLGDFNADNLAWLSFCCGVAVILLGARFADDLGGRKMSILCGILLVSSPLATALSRRGTQDSFAALLTLACLYLFDRCWRRRSVLDLIGLAFCLCLAFLTKETTLLLYPLMGIAAAYYFRAMELRASPWLLVPLITAPIVYFMVEIGICGGIGNFIGTYRLYASVQQTLDYTVHYEKGPWFRYLLDFLAIAPLSFIAAIVGFSVPHNAALRHGRNLALIYFAGAVLLFGQMPIVNVRLLLFADMFLRFAAAAGITYLATKIASAWSARVLYLGIAFVVMTDAFQFYRVFVAGNVYSPTTFLLLRAEGFYQVQ